MINSERSEAKAQKDIVAIRGIVLAMLCIPQVKIPRSASVNSKKCKPLFQNPQNEIPDFRKVKIPNSATENSCFTQKNWGLFFYISSFLISRYAHDLDSPVISTMYLTISFFFSFSLTFVRIISRARFF
jgi:hypothetical protein